jgi:Fe-S-cluster containining protein
MSKRKPTAPKNESTILEAPPMITDYVDPFRMDPTPGVLSIQCKTEEPESIGNFDYRGDRIQSDSIQVNDPENPDGFEQIYQQNAARACAGCKAHCCRGFVIRCDMSKADAKAPDDVSQADWDFMRKWFKPLPAANHTGWGYKHDCKALDPATGRCTQYASRPKLCRMYLCVAAAAGHTPDDNVGFYSQTPEYKNGH